MIYDEILRKEVPKIEMKKDKKLPVDQITQKSRNKSHKSNKLQESRKGSASSSKKPVPVKNVPIVKP